MPPENDDPSQNGSPETPAPAAGTPDIGNMVNAAVSNHIKRFTEKQFPTLLDAALKPVLDKIAQVQPTAPQSQSSEAPDLSGKAKKAAELVELQKQLDDLRAQNDKIEKARQETEARARSERLSNSLSGALQGAGVKGDLVKVLTHWLTNGSNTVRLGEDGNPYVHLLTKSRWGDEMEETAYPLEEGIKLYLKSDAGKSFMPAPAPAQASQKPVGHSFSPMQNGAIDASKLHTEEEKLAAFAAAFTQQTK